MKKRRNEIYGIIGLGRFGFELAQRLSLKGREIIAIDKNSNKIKDISEYTTNAFTVSDLSKETLEEAGIKQCDAVIICIGEQVDVSILTTLTVIQLGVKRVISKASGPEHGCVLEKLGAEVVYPEKDMADRLSEKLTSPKMLEYLSLSDDVDIAEIVLSDKLNNISVKDSELRQKFGLNIIAIKKNGNISTDILPSTVLSENDNIVVIGKKSDIDRLEDYLM